MLSTETEVFASGVTDFSDMGVSHSSQNASIHLPIVLPIGTGIPTTALLDTAAPFCIFDSEFLREMNIDFGDGEPITLSTRFGKCEGTLQLSSIRVPAIRGESIEVDITIFAYEDWSHGNFLGYAGFAQRLCWAVDPRNNLFYFGNGS